MFLLLRGWSTGFVFLLTAVSIPVAAGQPQSLPLTPLVIERQSGEPVSLQVEVARSAWEQAIGLMHRQSLADNRGMLFYFDEPKEAVFWMHNTYIPLDLLFVATDGSVFRIISNAKPLSLDFLRSDGPAQAVLEIRGGLAGELGLRPGDSVHHEMFGNSR